MRRAWVAVAVLVLVGSVAACSDDGDEPQARPGPRTTTTVDSPVTPEESAGLVDPEYWDDRQADYLEFAAGEPLDPGDPLSLLAHAAAARRAGDEPDLSPASVDDFEPIFAKLEAFEDTGDFDVNRLITLLLREGDALDTGLAAEIRDHILGFKYWWTEPTPAGVVDSQYYWTENHQIIFLANEYVAGQTYPDIAFTNDGRSGEEHRRHAAERLDLWFEWRARFGFSEWLSNVYWNEDMLGLLLLAEFADDDALARKASMLLDVAFVELAGHLQRGTFGATHGRSYQKDKLNGRDEDTFSTAKLAFDETPVPYENADSATLLAVAERYRPPEVARRIAAPDATAVFRTRAGIPLDPHAPIDPDVEAPYGLSFEGEEGLMAFWGMGGQFPWQVAPLSVETVKAYDLFETANFQKAADLAPVVADADDDTLRGLAAALATEVNPGLLSQVDTYTWRSPEVMLSTAQDWRPGQRGEQDHIWQATVDPDALVFTQHPRDGVPSADDPNANEGYWTGDAAMPRSAQVGNVSISIYAPQYAGGDGVGSGAYSFSYEPYTHAFFPTEHFDEVVERDGWVIGRKGDAYVALWSRRPTTWKQYTTDEFSRGLTERFDLIADGGPDNVWIVEVSTATDQPFGDFVEAIAASKPTAYPRRAAPTAASAPSTPALVTYDSPSQGRIAFGWDPKGTDPLVPLTVDGTAVDLHPDTFRWDAPFAQAAWDEGRYHAELDGATLDVDFTAGTRRTTK
ncbi:MAG: hypothetical protein R2746_00945 [Acidimicrobiales bacterium]